MQDHVHRHGQSHLPYIIECDDVHKDMKRDIARFDTSDYPADNVYDMLLANKKISGLVKDKNNGAIMTEFIGRAKMYAVRVDGKKDTKKAKGIKYNTNVQWLHAVFERRDRNDSPSIICGLNYTRCTQYPSRKSLWVCIEDKRYIGLDRDVTMGIFSHSFSFAIPFTIPFTIVLF